MSTTTQSEIDAILSNPGDFVDDAGASANEAPRANPGSKAAGPQSVDVATLLKIEVPVIVKLASRTMPLSDVMAFTLGAILEFDLSADSEFSLLVNNKCVGYGTAVKVGENFGLRVTRMATVPQRVQALR